MSVSAACSSAIRPSDRLLRASGRLSVSTAMLPRVWRRRVGGCSVAALEKFLHVEFPQVFGGGDISIESADGTSCLLRQRYSDRMLRPGGTVSGPTLMALADFAMFVVLLSAF